MHSSGRRRSSGQATTMGVARYDSARRRVDDRTVLLRRSGADSVGGDDQAPVRGRHAATHRGVSAAGDGEEGIELPTWLHGGDEVSGAKADERGRVGLSLRELK